MKRNVLIIAFVVALFFISCRYKRIEVDTPYVSEKGDVYIDSRPTESVIFINGKKIGKTPLVTKLWFTEESNVKIAAVPMYKDQFRQDIVLTVPTIPRHIMFFMTNKPKDKYKITENPVIIEEVPEEKEITEVKKEIYPSPTVLFSVNETFIDEKQVESVKLFAAGIKDIKNIKILIHGYADESGNKELNRKLSIQRAQAVAALLSAEGVSGERITLFGHGETYTVNNDGVYLEASVNRKVEIRIINDEENKPE